MWETLPHILLIFWQRAFDCLLAQGVARGRLGVSPPHILSSGHLSIPSLHRCASSLISLKSIAYAHLIVGKPPRSVHTHHTVLSARLQEPFFSYSTGYIRVSTDKPLAWLKNLVVGILFAVIPREAEFESEEVGRWSWSWSMLEGGRGG